MEFSEGYWYRLDEILKSIKSFSAKEINRLRGSNGKIWQSEGYDRIIRDENEYGEKMNYILQNAVRNGLAKNGFEYHGFWYVNEDSIK